LKGYVGSNLDRGFRIGRLGLVGRAGGGGNTPANLFRGGAARGSPHFTINGAPGVKSSGLGSGVINTSCVIFLGLRWGSGMLWAARAAVEAGLHGGAHRHAVFRSLR
jgi:hypothetical protein